MNKFDFAYEENLQLVPATETGTTYCRHCGKRIALGALNIHLLMQHVEIHDAISKEFDRKEARALAIAAN
jgi:hypothetical protein